MPLGSAPSPEAFTPLTSSPIVKFLAQGVQPPSRVYIQRDDILMVNVFTGTAQGTFTIRGRLLRPDGVIIPIAETFTPVVNRSGQPFKFILGEGFLLTLTVQVGAASSSGTPAYVIAWISHTETPVLTGLDYFDILLAGYVGAQTTVSFPTFPGARSTDGQGFLRPVLGVDPAAGVEISETVPVGARWRLIAFTANLVTSAVVGNRRVALLHDDGVNVYARSFATTNIVASTNVFITWADGYPNAANSDNQQEAPLPVQDKLSGGFRLRTSTVGLDPGDNWGQPLYLVEEWIEGQ
jgi:hypothetical protein